MGVTTFAVLLVLFVLGWAFWPFLPGLMEIVRRTDVAPLRIVRDSAIQVCWFADSFRRRVENELAEDMTRLARTGGRETVAFGDDATALVVGGDDACPLVPPVVTKNEPDPVVVAGSKLVLPDGCEIFGEIYGRRDIECGRRVVVRAVLTEQDLRLGRESVVLRWINAGGTIRVGTGTTLRGRAAACGKIVMEEGVAFERLHATSIEFGVTRQAPEPGIALEAPLDEHPRLKPADLPNRIIVTGRRWLVRGDLVVPAGRLIDADVVATGRTTLQRGVRLEGALKSRKNLIMENGVMVRDAVTCGRHAAIGEDCRIGGPLVVERGLTIGGGTVVGSSTVPTTVSAETIAAAPGVRCHGTVWAHAAGDVLLPAAAAAQPDRQPAEATP